ncbi:helix-turn-helix domain-containing protein [Palleronia caenipelagi]|uniref:Helix-turn-helix transcriptional regulator n=1 Tax=Palleronia caenipelagi TaxID=2489174 RepID=A0A547PMU1_9RHOB|nr:helix-turn-helix transcriptional regulator [Palleronia caenipelagi]TRD15462.1 helix-turn-helix transcriptional regulator [Palleronia caenipelagi]
MTKATELHKKWLQDETYKAEYDALAEEFSLSSALISARSAANMTQSEVAEKMATSQSYVARLESGAVKPTIDALKRYATATGSRLTISLEHRP